MALAVTATPTIAATPMARDQTPAYADDKIVCKGETRINSRFKTKVCKTRAQWEELRVQQQLDAKEMVDRPQIDTDRPGRGE